MCACVHRWWYVCVCAQVIRVRTCLPGMCTCERELDLCERAHIRVWMVVFKTAERESAERRTHTHTQKERERAREERESKEFIVRSVFARA